MALSLDDRLLGEKTHYYCSSSEDEDNQEDSNDEKDQTGRSQPNNEPTFIPESQLDKNSAFSTNTGPKGVINDWRRYKQLESEQRQEHELESKSLLKKLSLTCRSHLDEEKENEKLEEDEFLDADFLQKYREKRIEEMKKALVNNISCFGKVFSIDSSSFIDSIDKEKPSVTIIIHVYENSMPGCREMNNSLICLAQEYPAIKFCKMKASESKLSSNFASKGLPALLIYKNGELIGNFVQLKNELGDEFYATDVESFLQENGFLTPTIVTSSIRGPQNEAGSAEESDLEID